MNICKKRVESTLKTSENIEKNGKSAENNQNITTVTECKGCGCELSKIEKDYCHFCPRPDSSGLLTGKLITKTYQISDLCLDEQHRYCETEGCECSCHRI